MDNSKIQQVADLIRQSSLADENKQGLVNSVVTWMDKYPSLPGESSIFEHAIDLVVPDAKGRPFHFVAFIDRSVRYGDEYSIDELKTHRGPWRKGLSVDVMLEEHWDDKLLDLQAHCYLKALQLMGLKLRNKYMRRVLVKPGPYNEPAVREREFPIFADVLDGLWETFIKAASDARDEYFGMNPASCINKYRKLCPFWASCAHRPDKAVPLTTYVPNQEVNRIEGEFYFSVSRATKYIECPRKYKYNYVDMLGEGYQSYFEEGKVFHKCLQLIYS